MIFLVARGRVLVFEGVVQLLRRGDALSRVLHTLDTLNLDHVGMWSLSPSL